MDESDGYVEVCFSTNTGHTEPIDVVIAPIMKGVDNPAAGNGIQISRLMVRVYYLAFFNFLTDNNDFDARTKMQTFEASSTGGMLCVNITIISDTIYEGDEQFLVMFGNLPNNETGVGFISQSCITILDDERKLISCLL